MYVRNDARYTPGPEIDPDWENLKLKNHASVTFNVIEGGGPFYSVGILMLQDDASTPFGRYGQFDLSLEDAAHLAKQLEQMVKALKAERKQRRREGAKAR